MSGPGALSQDEAFARIRLLRSPHVGPVSYARLLDRHGGARAALEALPELAGRAGRAYAAAPEERVAAEIAAVRKADARYIFHDSPDYPALLARTEGAPPILVARGDAGLAARPCVAVVGARNASAGALRLAREFAHDLAGAGWTVVSGLARGIDGAAHRGALTRGGATIAVIAGGIDVAYPPDHAALQAQVAEEGLLLAEQPPGVEPLARHFPVRNRIIAGLAAGTLVVEAAPRSGSLITARLAGEMGREVMAVPGSPLDARSQGCNQLIRDGAILVQSAADVIELLSGFDGRPAATALREAGPDCRDGPAGGAFGGRPGEDMAVEDMAAEDMAAGELAGLLTSAPVGVDELIRQSGRSAGAVHMALLELELTGRLVRHAGGRVGLG